MIQYIEQAATQAAAAQKNLQEENDTLKAEIAALQEENASLKNQLRETSAHQEQLQSDLAQETSTRLELEKLKPLEAEVAQLRAETDALRPDAQAYAQFRERIGAIECDARKRAADLESATAAQLKTTVDQFRAQYQALMNTFETTASHVNSELRKVEVNLTQLPRAMDQSGADLNELAARLERALKEEA